LLLAPGSILVLEVVSTEILDRLGKLDPNKTLKTLIAEAIVEHIGNKTLSVTNKTPDIGFLNVDMTPNIGTILNNQMHVYTIDLAFNHLFLTFYYSALYLV
jgi:hypothetical protein